MPAAIKSIGMPEPIRIRVAEPTIGSKCWVVEEKGIYVLAEGPGILRGIACTHAGTGGLEILDGVPDARGFFPQHGLAMSDPKYGMRVGRPLYRAHPSIMGMWMLDAGFIHGLTVHADGDSRNANVIASIIWMEQKIKK